jgi:hypothetical protein
LVNGWINGAGPFTFAIDTGAGISIVNGGVAQKAGLRVTKSRQPIVGGLSKAPIASNEAARATDLAIGSKTNKVPGKPLLAIVNTLPPGLDGVLDPSDLFAHLAYSIDLPNRQLLAFDSRTNDVDLTRVPKDGAVVRWVRERSSARPFVRLGDGRLALIDTGSGFGLAVSDGVNRNVRNQHGRNVSDLGGGAVLSREVAPATVSIGALVLKEVPTDLLIGTAADTPVILGRRALYPFKLTFYPNANLIALEPAERR